METRKTADLRRGVGSIALSLQRDFNRKADILAKELEEYETMADHARTFEERDLAQKYQIDCAKRYHHLKKVFDRHCERIVGKTLR